MIFEPLTKDLIPACMEIFDTNCPIYFLKEERQEFEEWLETKTGSNPYWVLTENGLAIGCGGIYTSNSLQKESEFGKEACFAWGMIKENLHKKGYGKALFLYRLEYLKQHYPDYPFVLRTTQHSQGFYAKYGFETHKFEKDGWDVGFDKYTMLYK